VRGFGTIVSEFGLRNIQMFGAGLRSLATNLESDDLYDLGYRIEDWGESLELEELLDIGGGHAVGRIILAGEATPHFELAGVDPYTAHVVAASAVVAPAIDTWHTMGFTPEDVANTDIHRHMAYYLINVGTIETMGETMHETFLQLMAVHFANNPDPARTDRSLPEINEDAVIYPLDDENIMVVEPTYGNITIIEIAPP